MVFVPVFSSKCFLISTIDLSLFCSTDISNWPNFGKGSSNKSTSGNLLATNAFGSILSELITFTSTYLSSICGSSFPDAFSVKLIFFATLYWRSRQEIGNIIHTAFNILNFAIIPSNR